MKRVLNRNNEHNFLIHKLLEEGEIKNCHGQGMVIFFSIYKTKQSRKVDMRTVAVAVRE